jgi:hypothetical protein
MMGADKGKLGLTPLARLVSSWTRHTDRISLRPLHNFSTSQCIQKYQVTNWKKYSPNHSNVLEDSSTQSRAFLLHHVHRLPYYGSSNKRQGHHQHNSRRTRYRTLVKGAQLTPSVEPSFVLRPALGMSESMPKLHHTRDGG